MSTYATGTLLGEILSDDKLAAVLDEAVLQPIAVDPAAQVRCFFEFISREQAEAIYPDVIVPTAKRWLGGFRVGPDWIAHKGLVERLASCLASHRNARRSFFRLVAVHYGVPADFVAADHERDSKTFGAFSDWAKHFLETQAEAAVLPLYAVLCVLDAFETEPGQALTAVLRALLLEDAKALDVLALETVGDDVPIGGMLLRWFKANGFPTPVESNAPAHAAADLPDEAPAAAEAAPAETASEAPGEGLMAQTSIRGPVNPAGVKALLALLDAWRGVPDEDAAEDSRARPEAAFSVLKKIWSESRTSADFLLAKGLLKLLACLIAEPRTAGPAGELAKILQEAVSAEAGQSVVDVAGQDFLERVSTALGCSSESAAGEDLERRRRQAEAAAGMLFNAIRMAAAQAPMFPFDYNRDIEAIPRKNRRTGPAWVRSCLKAVLGFMAGSSVDWAVRQTKLPKADLEWAHQTRIETVIWQEALLGGVENFAHMQLLERFYQLLGPAYFVKLLRVAKPMRSVGVLERVLDPCLRMALMQLVDAACGEMQAAERIPAWKCLMPSDRLSGAAEGLALRICGAALSAFERGSAAVEDKVKDGAEDVDRSTSKDPSAAQEAAGRLSVLPAADEAAAADQTMSEANGIEPPADRQAVDEPDRTAAAAPQDDALSVAAQSGVGQDRRGTDEAAVEGFELTAAERSLLEQIALPPGALAPFDAVAMPEMPYEPGTHRWFGCVRLQGGFANFYPLAEISSSGRLRTISQEEAKHLFPNWGGFHLFNAMEHAGRSLMTLSDGLFLVLTVDDLDMEPNLRYGTTQLRDDYEKRVDFPALYRRGAVLLPDVFGIYPVVRAVSAQSSPGALQYVDAAEQLELRTQRITYAMPGQAVTDDALENPLKRPVVLEVRAVLPGGHLQRRSDGALASSGGIRAERALLGPLPLLEDAKKRLYVNLDNAAEHSMVRAWRLKTADSGALGGAAFCTFAVPGVPTSLPARTFAVLSEWAPAVCDLMRADALVDAAAALLESLCGQGGGSAQSLPAVKLLLKALRSCDSLAAPSLIEGAGSVSVLDEINALRIRRLIDAVDRAAASSRAVDAAAASRVLRALADRLLTQPAKEQEPAAQAFARTLAKDAAVERILRETPKFKNMEARAAALADEARLQAQQFKNERAKLSAEADRMEARRAALNAQAEALEAKIAERQADLARVTDALKTRAAQALAEPDGASGSAGRGVQVCGCAGGQFVAGASPLAAIDSAKLFDAGGSSAEPQPAGALDAVDAVGAGEPAVPLEGAAEASGAQTHADSRAKVKALSEAAAPCGLEGRKLADYLVTSVQGQRSSYERNFILSLFINLTQNFLTVFSGAPGSGKTSACNILARTLGLTSISQKLEAAKAERSDLEALWPDPHAADRYLPVSVERGWSSKRDFVGYWNPLLRRFESPDERRYECFRLLDAEAQLHIEALPYVILLDEANLSPMEYYFADFLNLCDERDAFTGITLGDRARYVVPDTLRFMATINNDHTTEILSPRLLDRAAVVTLPDPSFTGFEPETEPSLGANGALRLIGWPAMRALFGPQPLTDEHREILREVFVELYGLFAEAGISVSPRVKRGIERYASAACRVMRAADGRPGVRWAADLAAAERLLPKIAGSGSGFEAWLRKLKERLEANQLVRSAELVDDMLERGGRAMGYYKFF